MKLVSDLLALKGSQVWTIDCQASVGEALQLMAEKNVGAVVVLDAGYVVGIFSERDYARKAISIEEFTLATHVHELMIRRVFYVTPADTLDECMILMTSKRIRHLPVLDEGILVGIISIGDVVKQSLSEMDNRIKDLEEYLWVHLI